jgi:hypothetical protein
LNSSPWRFTKRIAHSRQSLRSSACDVDAIFSAPSVFSTMCSIGWPWQSQPGTYGATNPRIVLYRTTRSLSTLLNAVPMWMSPLAYGGPSCSTNAGPPALTSSERR